MRWPDFSKYGGMKLVVAALPSGHRKLIMMGGERYPALLSAVGFQKHGNFWMRDSLRFNADDFKRVFPRMFIRNIEESQILYRWNFGGAKEVAESKIALLSANPIGMNRFGETVHDGADGRFIKTDDGLIISEMIREPRFLGVRKDVPKEEALRDLETCLEGMTEEIVRGRVFRSDDIARLLSKIIDGREDISINEAYGAISGALLRRMRRGDEHLADDDAFRLAAKLHEGLPPLDQELEKSIIPLPIGVAVQRILGLSQGKVATNCIDNGAFVSMFDGAVDIIDGSEAGLAALNAAGVNASLADKSTRYDTIAAGLYGRALDDAANYKGMEFHRGDHVAMLEMLDQRREGGRSVFVLGADEDGRQGFPGAETTKLLEFLSARYAVDCVAELDGALFGRSGHNTNRTLVVVGPRQASQVKDFSEVEVVRDYGRLWALTEEVLAARNEAIAGKDTARVLDENGYQAPYVPVSQVSEAVTMTPRNLVGPTRKALAAVEERRGDVDTWVASCLQVDPSELGSLLAAEQVDAFALAVDAHLRGKGFVLGDQTGVGKGRVLAALTRYATLNGIGTIFLTEKKNLFSDFWRDIEDVGAASMVTPFVLNQGVAITDMDKRRVLRGSRKDEVQEFMQFTKQYGGIKPTANLVMATYSQFNKGGSERAEWLREAARDSLLILDESHVAAGEDSATGDNVMAALRGCGNVIYSSATFAKGSSNMGLYYKVLPDSVNASEIRGVLDSGGEALQEVFTSMLAEDGVFIRRELDLSDLTFETIHDDVHLAENEQYADKFADVLEVMGVITSEVSKFVNEENSKIKQMLASTPGINKAGKAGSMGLHSMNFGSRLYCVMRQFMTAVCAKEALRVAIEDIDNGRKPVIVVEQTNEALLKDFVAKLQEAAIDFAEPEGMDGSEEEELDVIEFDQQTLGEPVMFRDILRNLADKISRVAGVTSDGNAMDQHLDTDVIIKAREALELMIDAFPDLHASPIDLIKDGLTQQGHICAELSGRNISITEVIENGDNSWVIRRPHTLTRNEVIHGFNNGLIDALVITAAGSTGCSLHASERVADQRQRTMIELQIANNVATRLQFLGRVNRKGQVCPPIIRTLTSGLPAQNRLLSMQNSKLRRMSASTTSNRDNAVLTLDFPDVLNEVGNEVCRRYMETNLDIPRRLAIDPTKLSVEVAKKMGDKTWYVNQLTARMGMLHVAETRAIYDDIAREYESYLLELDSQGRNPFRVNEMDVNATTLDRKVFDGVEHSGYASAFDAPVYLSVIEYEEKFQPIRSAVVKQLVNAALEGAKSAGWKYGLSHLVPKVEAQRADLYLRCLSKDYLTVQDALADPKRENAVKMSRDRLNRIVELLPMMQPGSVIKFNVFGEETTGIITGVIPPDDTRLTMMSWYDVKVAWPGGDGVHTFTLSQLANDSKFEVLPIGSDAVMRAFDEAAVSGKMMQRAILDGNIFSAALISMEQKSGMPVVYSDNYGVRQRGILLPSKVYGMGKLFKASARLRDLNEAKATVDGGIPRDAFSYHRESPNIKALRTTPGEEIDPKTTVMIYRTRSSYGYNNYADRPFVLVVPTNQTYGGQFAKDLVIKSIVGTFKTKQGMKQAIIPEDRIDEFLEHWYKEIKLPLFATDNLRPVVNAHRKVMLEATQPAPEVAMQAI